MSNLEWRIWRLNRLLHHYNNITRNQTKKIHLKSPRNLTWITYTYLSLRLKQNWIPFFICFPCSLVWRLFTADWKYRISRKFAILKTFIATFLVWTDSKTLSLQTCNAGLVLFLHKLIFSQLWKKLLRTTSIFAYAKKHFCSPRFPLNNG